MSRKNRYKFRDRSTGSSGAPTLAAPSPSSSATNSSGSSSVASPSMRPLAASSGAMSAHVAEYRIISKDLIRLIVLNGIMLAAVLVVYFTNQSSGYLERIFHSLF